MFTLVQKDELDALKAQMQVLKSHLSNSDIVSDEMLETTIKSSARSLTGKRLWNMVALVCDLLLAGYITYVCLALHKCGVLFMVATIVWCVFLAFVNLRQYKDNIRGRLLDGNLVDTVRAVTAWKRSTMSQGISIAIATVIWSAFCLNEIWADITTDTSNAVLVAVLYIFVLGTVGSRYYRTNKVTSDLLRQIETLHR